MTTVDVGDIWPSQSYENATWTCGRRERLATTAGSVD
jgi:hypothetical protein